MRKQTLGEGIVIGAILGALLALMSGFPAIWRHHHSCALCRLARNDYGGLGRRSSEFEETECSKWYAKNIEPHHEHAWAGSPSRQLCDIFGTPMGVSDSERPAGFMRLTPTEQIAVYQHIPSADDAKRLFLNMRDDMESRDESRYARVRSLSRIVRDCVDSEFGRPWNEVEAEIAVE